MRLCLALAFALLMVGSCRPTPQRGSDTPIDIGRIHIVGHGMAFDAKMHEIPLDLKTILGMQAWLRGTLQQRKLAPDAAAQKLLDEVRKEIGRVKNNDERAVLNAVFLARQIDGADEQTRLDFDWRNRFIGERALGMLHQRPQGFRLSDTLLRYLREARLVAVDVFSTAYMRQCSAAGVPIPPDFSITEPNGWSERGALVSNMLVPGANAGVWAWGDPGVRGGCIALPRSNGRSQTGIICQAATGAACFWDNIRRSDGRAIPSASEVLVIRQLKDGTNLTENCTGCHTGNNVFLMAPDDPAWASVMRGDLGDLPPSFTISVEGGARYRPIAQAGWINPPPRADARPECIGCHEMPRADVETKREILNAAVPAGSRPVPMPPACVGMPRGCYR